MYIKPSCFTLTTTFLAALVLACQSITFAADTTWTGADPDDNLFGNANNWDSGVPGVNDRGIFDLDDTFTVDFDADYSSNQLLIGGAGISAGEHAFVTFDLLSNSTSHTYSLLGDGGGVPPVASTAIQIFGANDPGAPTSPGAALVVTGGTLSTLRPDPDEDPRTLQLVHGTASVSGVLAVSGSNAHVEADRLRMANGNNSWARFIVQNSGSAAFGDIQVNSGNNSSAQGFIQVIGVGSTLDAGSELRQSQAGNLSITVANEGSMTVGNLILTQRPGGVASVRITGENSTLQTGLFRINETGDPTKIVDVIIDDGGVINSSGVVEFNRFGGNESAALITGAGSKWVSTNTAANGGFNLGGRLRDAPAVGSALLIVADGGVLETVRTTVHWSAALHGDSTVTASNTGANAIWNRGGLVGPGLVDYSHTHDGTTFTIQESIGTLTLKGNYTQEVIDINGDVKVATLRIKIGNPSADLLNVEGDISLLALNGTKPLLDIVEFGSPTLNENDTFQILNWTGSITVDGFNITAFDPGEGLGWDFSELYTTGFITVIPEPSPVMLIAIAVAFLLLIKRRKPRMT